MNVSVIKSFLLLASIFIITKKSTAQVEDKSFNDFVQKTKELVRVYPDSASKDALKIMSQAKLSNDSKKIAEAYILLAEVKMVQSKADEALKLCDTALVLNQKLKYQKGICQVYGISASSHLNKTDLVQAVKMYLKTIEIANKTNDYKQLNNCYNGLFTVSSLQYDKNKIREYLKLIMITAKQSQDDRASISSNQNLAKYYNSIDSIEKSNSLYDEALKLSMKNKFDYTTALVLSNWSINYAKSDLNKTLAMMLEAQKLFDAAAPHNSFSHRNIANIGEVFAMFLRDESLRVKFNLPGITPTRENLFIESKKYMELSLLKAATDKNIYNVMSIHGNLANLFQYMKIYDKAYPHLERYAMMKDSVYSQDNKNAIAKLEAEKDLINLQNINNQKSTMNNVLIGSTLALLIISFLGYRNFRNKQKIQDHQIVELEKEKQITAIDALLKGQEEERSRLAKDLHDGLGGMLNGVKLQFNNMRENLVMTADNVVVFQNSLNQLDGIIGELRKVSHNLMPDTLIRFGLVDALKDFCDSQNSTHIKVAYQPMGNWKPLDNTTNLYIYRIIQELINNAIKHGDASQILAQTSFETDKILITVDDNGKGFDISAIDDNKGIGMRNIKQRIDYLKGKLDINSDKELGTSVNIELPI